MLLPLITRELRHVVRNDAIKRGTDAAKHRAVCGELPSLRSSLAHDRFLLFHHLWRLVFLQEMRSGLLPSLRALLCRLRREHDPIALAPSRRGPTSPAPV
jgi:hypothetical protein